ncbi:zinc finger protein 420-like [Anopheles moucheti]|uniref:zinc finger protein 420-like n=1 Tax=Anopheles moucheti TaxID=186751 RepID=UPI0022F016B2|nr:zinc finger protein 420-like [Anopheles moucheti]
MLNIDVEHRLELAESSEPELLGRRFVIPKLDYVNSHIRFNNIEYVELSGPMCCGCDFIAENTNNLMDHIVAKHTHITRGPNDSFVCDICYKAYEDKHQLQSHRQWFLNTEIFVCHYCSYGFTCEEHLTRHLSTCIEQEEESQLIEHKEQKTSLDDHLPTKIENNDHHGAIILDNAMVTDIIQQQSLICESTKTNSYGCCFLRCSASFDREIELHRHVRELHAVRQRIHQSERTSDQYVCDTCQLNFKSNKTLQRHRNGWKLKQNNVCFYCSKGFITPGALKDHVQQLHIDTSPQFRCERCGKQFRKSSLLKLHLITHRQDRQYGCDQCDARFHFGYQLKKHLQAVHATEFPYDCSQCNRKMPNKHRYDLHMRMHTGEKPYACRHDCGRKFAHATDRRRHEMVTHTGEKPHRCNSCSMAFVRRRELQQHYRQFKAHDVDISVC